MIICKIKKPEYGRFVADSPFLNKKMVRGAGLEPANLSVLEPKSSASANFASRAEGNGL